MRDRPVFDSLSARQAEGLLLHARALMQAPPVAPHRDLLRGRHLGLVCASPEAADAVLFQRAAAELGARVAVIRADGMEAGSAQEMQHTGRLLAQLYDALECQDVRPAVSERLAQATGVPVYAGLATAAHPTAGLAALVEGDAGWDEKRRRVLQAALLESLL